MVRRAPPGWRCRPQARRHSYVSVHPQRRTASGPADQSRGPRAIAVFDQRTARRTSLVVRRHLPCSRGVPCGVSVSWSAGNCRVRSGSCTARRISLVVRGHPCPPCRRRTRHCVGTTVAVRTACPSTYPNRPDTYAAVRSSAGRANNCSVGAISTKRPTRSSAARKNAVSSATRCACCMLCVTMTIV